MNAGVSASAAATVLYEPDVEVLTALLDAVDDPRRKLFIFVNGAVDPAVDARLASLQCAQVIRSSKNLGLAHGLNVVIEAAAAEGHASVLLLDQDSAPDPLLHERLLDADARARTGGAQLAAIGPRLVPPPGTRYLPVWYSRRLATSRMHPDAVDYLPTSGSLLSIQAWREVGPFRADLFVDQVDVEWGLRAAARGYPSLLARDVRMVHRWGDDSAKSPPQIMRASPLRAYYHLRNALYVLTLPHASARWSVVSGARLAAQAALLLLSPSSRRALPPRMVLAALARGWRGELGPASLEALPPVTSPR